MSNKSSITGFDSLAKRLAAIPAAVNRPVKETIARRALEVETDAKRSVRGGVKTGTLYIKKRIWKKETKNNSFGSVRYITKDGSDKKIKQRLTGYVYHQSSAAGEAPATDTGRLISSITSLSSLDGLEAEIGVFGKIATKDKESRNYATDLEFGTTKMAARPFLQPALEKNKEKIVKTINQAIDRAVKDTLGG